MSFDKNITPNDSFAKDQFRHENNKQHKEWVIVDDTQDWEIVDNPQDKKQEGSERIYRALLNANESLRARASDLQLGNDNARRLLGFLDENALQDRPKTRQLEELGQRASQLKELRQQSTDQLVELEQLESYKAKNQWLSKDNSQLKESIAKLREERRDLSNELAKQQVKMLTSENRELQQNLEYSNLERIKQHDQLETLLSEAAALRREFQESETKVKQLTDENSNLQKEIEDKNLTIENKAKEAEKLNIDNFSLELQLQSNNLTLEFQKQTNMQLENQLKESINLYDQSQKENEQLKKQNTDYQAKIEELKRQLAFFNCEIDIKDLKEEK